MNRKVLEHRVAGRGEPLLLLNGGMMSLAGWDPTAALLEEDFRVVRCDLRGQLLSPGAPPRDLSGNVDDVVALLDALDLGVVHLLGTSYGGAVAVHVAAQRPERVASLVAVTVGDRATPSVLEGARDLARLLRGDLEPATKGRIYDRLVEDVYSADWRERHDAELAARREVVVALPDQWFRDLDGILDAVTRLDLRAAAGAVRCPALVVVAGGDRVFPPATCRALADLVEGAATRLHPTSGHALVAEDPEWLAQTALDFLHETTEDGRR